MILIFYYFHCTVMSASPSKTNSATTSLCDQSFFIHSNDLFQLDFFLYWISAGHFLRNPAIYLKINVPFSNIYLCQDKNIPLSILCVTSPYEASKQWLSLLLPSEV